MTSRACRRPSVPRIHDSTHGLSLTGGARSPGQPASAQVCPTQWTCAPATTHSLLSPYVELDRAAWARLRDHHPLSLTQADVTRLRGLGERLDLARGRTGLLPPVSLLNFYVGATRACTASRRTFGRAARMRTPVRHRRGGRWLWASPPLQDLRDLLRWPARRVGS